MSGDTLPDFYDVQFSPIPNLASSVIMGLLSIGLDSQSAGRLFVAGSVLLFAGAYGLLVRTLQRQSTIIEYLGLPWAFGYFLYMGYLSYIFSLGLAFLGIAILIRSRHSPRATSWALTGGLAALSVLLYLSHAGGWTVYALVVCLCSLRAAHLRYYPRTAALLGSLVPSLLMLAWYGSRSRAGDGTTLYHSVADKVDSLVNPLMLVLRIDPFPPLVPVFIANLILLTAIALLILWNIAPAGSRQPDAIIVAAGGILIAMGIIFPFAWFAGLLRPDERLLFPGILLLLAALPARPLTILRGAVLGLIIAGLLAFHAVEYRQTSHYLASTEQALRTAVPQHERLLVLSVHTGNLTQNACEDARGPSMGIPVLQHFAMNRLLTDDPGRAELFETGLIAERSGSRGRRRDLAIRVVTTEAIAAEEIDVPEMANEFQYVQVVGCTDHIEMLTERMADRYDTLAEGPGFSILDQ